LAKFLKLPLKLPTFLKLPAFQRLEALYKTMQINTSNPFFSTTKIPKGNWGNFA